MPRISRFLGKVDFAASPSCRNFPELATLYVDVGGDDGDGNDEADDEDNEDSNANGSGDVYDTLLSVGVDFANDCMLKYVAFFFLS